LLPGFGGFLFPFQKCDVIFELSQKVMSTDHFVGPIPPANFKAASADEIKQRFANVQHMVEEHLAELARRGNSDHHAGGDDLTGSAAPSRYRLFRSPDDA
jgi:hypothetical protein